MKAMVYTDYGSPDVLQLRNVETPTPKDNEVLVRIHATTVNFGDLLARNFGNTSPGEFHMPFLFWLLGRVSFGLKKPRRIILGNEFAGEVQATGIDVKRFTKGDPVFGYCSQTMGAYAEYLCLPETAVLAIKPANMTYEEAAVIPYGGIMALNLLKQANLQPGQSVLINGASGGIGSAAVQLARHLGASVTGVCATPRLDFVRSLGANEVIDYAREDFTRSRETYDVVFDILGKSSFARAKGILKPNGRYVLVSFKMKQVLQMLWTSLTGGKRVVCALLPEKAEDLILIQELAEAGKIRAVIDKRFPLEQVAEAHRYVEAGHKRGSVVITVAQDAQA
jgi:NADPH:quinone reductase-like Zn-dependent oxidoreductase